ncbi:UDP-N-acetylmuramoyl-L-alanyl-D-glutamate--2,6-diaminopimelate ligase [Candidatus Margulisiibacteriota bacterium]
MKLSNLLSPLKDAKTTGDENIIVSGIAYDSRNVNSGDIFVAIPGFSKDGTAFVPDAVKKGAKAVVVEKDIDVPDSVTKTIVPNARLALAKISSAFYGHPSKELKLIGVTGTNGKTTTAYFIEAMFRKKGYKVGVITTVEARIDGRAIPTKLTTPESAELQELLAQMVKEGVTHVVMEVSSHSLQLDRVVGCEFDAAVFTNLTHEHLDFHGDMKSYLETKMKLFQYLDKGGKEDTTAIVNADDPYGKKIVANLESDVLTYGVNASANLRGSDLDVKFDKMTFNCKTADQSFQLTTSITGIPNAYNIMAAVLVARLFAVDIDTIKKAVKEVNNIPGRFEKVVMKGKPHVVVDFAHSPDSLQKLLETVKPMTKGKVILVFGCPGDRDKTKRAMMGEIAVKLSDYFIISTDDPHTEEPGKIIDEIEEGVKKAGGKIDQKYVKIEDRRAAIEKAVKMAKIKDLVVLAGRGHEKFQEFGGKKVAIDDREVAREVLKNE